MAAVLTTLTVLMDFYQKMDGDNWTIKTNWNTSPDYCLWHGVTCDLGNEVFSIILPANKLSGELPESLSQLTNLKAMILSNNNISSIHPKAFIGKSYCAIDLSNNKLVQVPTCFKADFADFSFNQLTSFPAGSAKNLNLKCNAIVGELPLLTPPTYDFTCNAGINCPVGNLFCGMLDCLECLI